MSSSSLAILTLLSCVDESVMSPVPPNVLLVTLDTTRADHLGSYGHPAEATPNLDALARRGVRFSRAYTVTPLTIPAHSSLFTGLYPPRHGVRDNGDFFLSEGADTLAEYLKTAGYDTMASVGAEVTSHHWGFAQGFDAFFDDMGGSASTEQNRWRVERPGNLVIDDAIGWLSQQSDGPWFSWVHLFDVHHPYEPPPPYDYRYADPYVGELAFADGQVGRLLDWIESQGELDNTLVVVLSDHGEGRGAHGEGLHGVLLYDATTRIPLIIQPPGGQSESTVINTPASIVDVMPTVLAAVGEPIPAGLDGIDLLAATERSERVVYLESRYAYHHYGWAPQEALVDPEYKLISSTTPELYSRVDVRERNELSERQPERRAAMQSRLDVLTGDMVPLEGTADKVSLSAERTAQLEALGYLTTEASTESPEDGLPDPVERLPLLGKVESVRLAMKAGDLQGAHAAAEALLAEEPGLNDIRINLATLKAQLGDIQGAEDILVAMIEDQPGSSRPLSVLGSIELRRGNLKRSVQLLEQAIEIDPYISQSWAPYLGALFIQGNFKKLSEQIERARSFLPSSPEVAGMEAMMMAKRGERGAEDALRAALEAQPRQPFVRIGLAQLLREQGEDSEAEGLLLDEIYNRPPAVQARKALVRIYAEQERYAEQIEQLDVIITVQPPSHVDFHSRAQARFNITAYESALEDIDQCQKLAPNYAPCVMLEANALKKTGHDAAAEAAYRRALEMAASQP